MRRFSASVSSSAPLRRAAFAASPMRASAVFEARQGPRARLLLDGGLLPEVGLRLQRAHQVFERPARIMAAAQAVQAQEVALQGRDHALRAVAPCHAALALPHRFAGASRGCGQHHAVERRLGGIAHRGLHVRLLDAGLAAGVEHELLQLRA